MALKTDFLSPIPPRLIMGATKYAQPFLIHALVNYTSKTLSERRPQDGYALIAATGFLYVVLAFSTTYYQHKTYQIVTKLRGALVTLVFMHMQQSSTSGLVDNAPVTLMSTDVDVATTGIQGIHELWASPAEIGIAVWLLERQIGVLCIIPLSIALSEYSYFPLLPIS